MDNDHNTSYAKRIAAEEAAIARLERACASRQNVFLNATGHWGVQGAASPTGLPLYDLTVAEAEVREAQEELNRIGGRS